MRNKKILPNTLVPKRLRFKLYEQAYYDLIRKNPVLDLYGPVGLCLSLPIYLWGLESILQLAPNGEDWKTEDTPNMFPELREELMRLQTPNNHFMGDKNRILFLERILNINQSKYEK